MAWRRGCDSTIFRAEIVGSLSSDVFERRTSTGSEPFFVLLSFFTLLETIWPEICSKSRLKSTKSPLPVNVRYSKTLLLKLPSVLYNVKQFRVIFLIGHHGSVVDYQQNKIKS